MFRVLIVDDEQDIREAIQLALEDLAGWKVFAASSGADGLSIAQQEQPDAILLDVRMAVMDGIKTLHYLRLTPETCSIPVIFFTSADPNLDPAKHEQLAIAGIIYKPIAPMDLIHQMCNLLNWPT